MEDPQPGLAKPKPGSYRNSSSTKPLRPQAKKISISILVISLPVLYVSLLHIPPSTLFKDTVFWFLMSNSIIIIVAADSGVFNPSGGQADDLYDEFIRHSKARSTACLPAEPPPELGEKESLANEQGLPQSTSHVAAAEKEISVVVNEKPLPAEREIATNCSIVVYEPLRQSSVAVVDDRGAALQEEPVHEAQVMEEDFLPGPRKAAKESKTSNEKSLRLPATAVDRSIVVKKETPPRRTATEKRDQRSVESEYSKLTDEELNKRVEDFIRSFNREIRLQLRNECVC